jgi:hypothetical protein
MVLGYVERLEVVVLGLYIRPLGDIEADGGEHLLDLTPHQREGVQAPHRRHVSGMGDVHGRRLALCRPSQIGGALLQQIGELDLDVVEPPARHGTFLRVQVGDGAQQRRHPALAPQPGHPGLFQRLFVLRRLDGGPRFGEQTVVVDGTHVPCPSLSCP